MHTIEYVVVADGITATEPFTPVGVKPVPVQVAVLVLLHVRVDDWPAVMAVGLVARVTVGAGILFTVTETTGEVALFPAMSNACAKNVCVPLARVHVSKTVEYGMPGNVANGFVSASLKNRTLVTPTLSEDVADIVIEPDTVDPLIGAVSVTVGGIVSRVLAVAATDWAEILPAAS